MHDDDNVTLHAKIRPEAHLQLVSLKSRLGLTNQECVELALHTLDMLILHKNELGEIYEPFFEYHFGKPDVIAYQRTDGGFQFICPLPPPVSGDFTAPVGRAITLKSPSTRIVPRERPYRDSVETSPVPARSNFILFERDGRLMAKMSSGEELVIVAHPGAQRSELPIQDVTGQEGG